MATLTMTVGPVTATVTADNAKAANVLAAYGDSIGATGTNQEKMQTILNRLVEHMRDEAHRYRRTTEVARAIVDLQDELDQTTWEE